MMAEPTDAQPAQRRALGGLLRVFRPAPAAPVVLTNAGEIARKLSRWQRRVLVLSITGYATFYFVRKNLGFAMPVMGKDLGIDKEAFGIFLTLHGVLYGVSKFANGFLADRANARLFMACALVVSALLNVIFGFNSAVVALGIIWMLNGWFQGMGFPPCARLIANWYPPEQLATKFSIWNTSHNIGSCLIAVFCGYSRPGQLAALLFCSRCHRARRRCFAVVHAAGHAAISRIAGSRRHAASSFGSRLAGGFQSLHHGKCFPQQIHLARFLRQLLRLYDPLRRVRLGANAADRSQAHPHRAHRWMMAGFEAFGLIGALIGGWITDRFLGGRAGRACVVYMALAGVSVFLFWKILRHRNG